MKLSVSGILVSAFRWYMIRKIADAEKRKKAAELRAKDNEELAREYNDWQRQKIRLLSGME